jgi:hypothetical protein
MKFKVMQKAKETWRELKDKQKAYIFEAVWNGELVPGMPREARLKVNYILSKIGGSAPGLKYKQIYDLLFPFIKDYENQKWDAIRNKQLEKLLLDAYPVKRSVTRKVSDKELIFNETIQIQLKIVLLEVMQGQFNKSGRSFLVETLLKDLQESEVRDKKKVLENL